MQVTFISNTRIFEYHPGNVYRTTLTPLLAAVLRLGVHLTLLDPLTLEDEDGSGESDLDPTIRRTPIGPDYGTGIASTSANGFDSGEGSGSEVGRDKKLHGRSSPPDERGASSGQSAIGSDDTEREESNSN